MYVVFSTTFTTGHVQGLNTDLLMTLPYTAAAYLYIRGLLDKKIHLIALGGIMTGLAFQSNPKGIIIILLH